MYYVNKIGWAIFNPLVFGLIILSAAAVLAFTKVGSKRMIGWICAMTLLWLWLWATSIPQFLMIKGMSDSYPEMQTEDVPQADVIIDMGGGIGAGRFYPELHESADRALHSARLWKAKKAPVIIPSGKGVLHTDVSFLKELGVPDAAILVENEARNTEENARFVSDVIREKLQGKTAPYKVLLVTSIWHLRRSALMFERYAPDLNVIPISTDVLGVVNRSVSVKDFLPDANNFQINCVLLHEIVGYYWYKFFR